ncbi:MAG: endonuclease/exonuclease/phosphatase family protein [Croceibacterium sp.]
MRLTFASYNIHKGIGLDRKRDPERILSVLHEIDADVVALQEADMRFGSRAAVLPRRLLEERHWHVAALSMKPAGMAWHGNAILVRRGIEILSAEPIALPVLEPRGAVCARLRLQDREFVVVGMHLDLSGLLRRQQVRAICAQTARLGKPAVMMGDFNEWSTRGGALRAFDDNWEILCPGRSFPSRSPLAQLDRIVHSREWRCEGVSVHHSALAAVASDHLPVRAALNLSA